MKKFLKHGACVASIVLLSACGGGGSDGTVTTPSPPTNPSIPATGVSISGTAATGLAIGGASVIAKCVTGIGTATTASNGTYIMDVANGQLPCVLQVTNPLDQTKLHALAIGGAQALVNLTPLTEMATARALGKPPVVFFASFDVPTLQQKATSAGLTSAETDVRAVLADILNPNSIGNFTSAALVAATTDNLNGGNDQDKALDALKKKLNSAQVGLVSEALASGANTTSIKNTITILAAAPSASVGVQQNVLVGTTVTLDGSGSTGAQGGALTFKWTVSSKPIGSNATLSTATNSKPTFIADTAGEYVFTLVVNDGKTDSAASTVTVSAAMANVAPVANAGKVTTKVGKNGSYARAVAIQSDGKIVVAGNSVGLNQDTDAGVVRYNIDGSLDTSFGQSGVVVTNISGRVASTDWIRGLAIQNDGKIIVAGYTQKSGDSTMGLAIIRYNPDGSLDTSFSDTGVVTSIDSGKHKIGHAVALQADGKILIAGAVSCTNRQTPGYCTLIERYNTDGSIDSTFNGPGATRVDVNTSGASGFIIQSDGKILIVGSRDNGNGDELSVARYQADGAIDTTFGNSGVSTVSIGSEIGSKNYGTSISRSLDGGILVAGVAHSRTKNNHFALTKLTRDGQIDRGFGSNGSIVTYVSVPPDSSFAYGMAVQSDGKILVAGESSSTNTNVFPYPGVYRQGNIDFAVVRFTQNGELDTSFGNNGIAITDFSLLEDRVYSIALQSNGLIILAGSSFTHDERDSYYGGYDSIAVARYNTKGVLDVEFSAGRK